MICQGGGAAPFTTRPECYWMSCCCYCFSVAVEESHRRICPINTRTLTVDGNSVPLSTEQTALSSTTSCGTSTDFLFNPPSTCHPIRIDYRPGAGGLVVGLAGLLHSQCKWQLHNYLAFPQYTRPPSIPPAGLLLPLHLLILLSSEDLLN